jgi:DNA polymerase I-like protein with 3'-5' exonuclease and polymerase domains
MRKFVIPSPGWGLAQGDYCQQEVLIAAILSGDMALFRTYQEGDCYLGLGKQLGLIPPDGTEKTHSIERDRCKCLMLGILYRMGVNSLAARLKISWHEARSLHTHLHKTFATYFDWTEGIVALTRAGHPLVTPYGWRLHPRYYADSSRTRTNFLVQSTAADVLRAACLLAASRGLEIIMTVHDSIIIQAFDGIIEEHARVLQEVMIMAAQIVLGDLGAAMRIDLEIIHSDQQFHLKKPDEARYQEVLRWLAEIHQPVSLIV